MPAEVDLTVADYLKAPALFIGAASPSPVAWGARGIDSEIISPLYNPEGATNEAARQAAFLAGPLVEDTVVVDGARRDLMGKTVTIAGDRLGYTEAGKVAFVLGFTERADGQTELVVLRSLA